MKKSPTANVLLRQARLARKWSQRRLAEEVGVQTQTVKSWESGKRSPLPDSRTRLCDLFGMTPEQLGLQLPDPVEQDGKEQMPSVVVLTDSVETEASDVQAGERNGQSASFPQGPRLDANRRSMLRRVRSIWIEGVLRHSLRQAALIALDLQKQPDAVVNPWQVEVQETNLPPHLLPVGTSIEHVYDQANGELLILGGPGAGKTTLLLELAQVLLDRADRDPDHLIPVVFTLSSWSARQQSLADWLAEELRARYHVPRKVGQQWIANNQILPLLDGLDEVEETLRPACVRAINAYKQQQQSFAPLVVCCRREDYEAAATRIVLQQAVLVQPLTDAQIESYLSSLSRAGGHLEAVRRALADDSDLLEMARSPLMLSIVTLAYQGTTSPPVVSAGSVEARRHQVFAVYIQRMLSRRGAYTPYRQEQTLHWLAWLARQMQEHNQPEMYLERMQPDWLPDLRSRERHRHTVIRVIYGSTYMVLAGALGIFRGGTGVSGSGIGKGLLGWLGAGPGNSILGWLAPGLGVGISGGGIVSLIFGLTAIVIGVLVSSAYGEARANTSVRWSGRRLRQSLISGLFSGCITALLIGAFSGILFGLKGGLSFGFSYALPLGLVGGLNIGLLSGLFTGLRPDRHRGQKRGERGRETSLVDVFIIGIGGGVCFGVTNAWVASPSQGFLYGAAVGLFGGLLFRWDRKMGGDLTRMLGVEIRPAEIMTWSWTSVRRGFRSNCVRSLSIGLFMLVSVSLVIGAASALFGGVNYGLAYGLVYGPIVGVTVAIASILMGILNSGWSSDLLDEHQLVRPNEGIRRSLRNGLFAALLGGPLGGIASGAVVGLAFGLVARLPGWPVLAAGFAIIFAIVFSLNFGNLYGGTACIEHFALRYRLWKAGCIPWDYVRFLNYSSERILLRKVGGGYMFVHRLLQDYFAALEPATSSTTSEEEATRPGTFSEGLRES